MKPKKTLYYKDELNDDFAARDIKTKDISEKYNYEKKGILWRFASFILYYVVAVPIVTVYNRFVHGERIKNKKVLRKYKRKGYFLYGNHTMEAADAFTPGRITFPHKANIIVSPTAVSVPVVSSLVEMLGGIPVATTFGGMRKFASTISDYSKKNKTIMIYPEAHIWPYYTGIRPFKDVSFKYPAMENKPVFCFTRVFRKRLFRKRPGVTVYIDGPFFPKSDLSVKENQKYLRDKVYDAMTTRARANTVDYIRYVKIDEAEAQTKTPA